VTGVRLPEAVQPTTVGGQSGGGFAGTWAAGGGVHCEASRADSASTRPTSPSDPVTVLEARELIEPQSEMLENGLRTVAQPAGPPGVRPWTQAGEVNQLQGVTWTPDWGREGGSTGVDFWTMLMRESGMTLMNWTRRCALHLAGCSTT
jgi:hypothetical protein